ncbi:MAG: methylated-DNA--[protein]-cysteine S-methyltransferase, partial [Actinobacteria bacterium]|nr:methylated-DNA--[protein]-cysteine S-methyltransferase [Actinomycetota bacterium]
GEYLTGLWIAGQKYFAAPLNKVQDAVTANRVGPDELPVFIDARSWLDRYFEGEDPGPIPAVKPRGSQFREGVWELLCAIPYGEVVTYGELARQMAALTGKTRMSSQAVGGAVGHNPISIIIPCHRVVGSDGSLTGYAGGLGIKEHLLALEGLDMSRFYMPTKGTAL